MDQEDFKRRTRDFAASVIMFVRSVQRDVARDVVLKQLIRSATSVGANYRAACRARSGAEFISKLGIVEEECDESVYWMELLIDTGQPQTMALTGIMNEANQILAITVASIRTARRAKN